eukprot:374777_1
MLALTLCLVAIFFTANSQQCTTDMCDALQATVDGVQATVDDIDTDVSTVQVGLDGVQTSVDAVQTTVDNQCTATQCSDISDLITLLQGAGGSLTTQLNTLQATVDDSFIVVVAQLNEILNRVEAIEALIQQDSDSSEL